MLSRVSRRKRTPSASVVDGRPTKDDGGTCVASIFLLGGFWGEVFFFSDLKKVEILVSFRISSFFSSGEQSPRAAFLWEFPWIRLVPSLALRSFYSASLVWCAQAERNGEDAEESFDPGSSEISSFSSFCSFCSGSLVVVVVDLLLLCCSSPLAIKEIPGGVGSEFTKEEIEELDRKLKAELSELWKGRLGLAGFLLGFFLDFGCWGGFWFGFSGFLLGFCRFFFCVFLGFGKEALVLSLWCAKTREGKFRKKPLWCKHWSQKDSSCYQGHPLNRWKNKSEIISKNLLFRYQKQGFRYQKRFFRYRTTRVFDGFSSPTTGAF